jgi:hypothetical protein
VHPCQWEGATAAPTAASVRLGKAIGPARGSWQVSILFAHGLSYLRLPWGPPFRVGSRWSGGTCCVGPTLGGGYCPFCMTGCDVSLLTGTLRLCQQPSVQVVIMRAMMIVTDVLLCMQEVRGGCGRG